MNTVAIGILAAGRATRFGAPKVLAPLDGVPIVRRAVDAAVDSGLRPIVVVGGARTGGIEAVLPTGVDVVAAMDARLGIAHSLRALVRALEGWRQVGAVCVGLADQPLVGPEAYRRLAAAYAAGFGREDPNEVFAVATYQGRRDHPVLIGRRHWPAVASLRGDVGARALMDSVAVQEIDCDGTGRSDDVDTIDDLARLQQEMEN